MNAPSSALLLAVLAVTAPCELNAQQDSTLAVGERVRISKRPRSAEYGDPVTGSLTEIRRDTLVVQVESPNVFVFVPLSSVKKLEVSRGKKSRARTGATVGFWGGALAGAVIVLASDEQSDGGLLDINPEELVGKTAGGAVVGALIGAAVGAGIGALFKTDRWEEIPLDELRIGPSPIAPDGVSVSASLRL